MAKKVVILDDDQKIVMLVEKVLSELGFLVYSANDGETALELTREIDPDLVVADILVPGVDGLQVCRTIKADPRSAHTKVILMTGVYKESNLRAELQCGADGLIEKPVDANRLSDLVIQKIGELV